MIDNRTPTTSRGGSPEPPLGPPPAYSEADTEISPSSSVSARIAQVLDQSTKQDTTYNIQTESNAGYHDTGLQHITGSPRSPPPAAHPDDHHRQGACNHIHHHSRNSSSSSSFDKAVLDPERGDLGEQDDSGLPAGVRLGPTKHDHEAALPCCGGCCGLLGIAVALSIAVVAGGGVVV